MKVIKALALLSSLLLSSCNDSKDECSFVCELESLVIKTEYIDNKLAINE